MPGASANHSTHGKHKASAVSLNDFTVSIPESTGTGSSPAYATLHEGAIFTIALSNAKDVDCQCDVSIDGILVGHYYVAAHSEEVIERPTGLDKCFVFSASGSMQNFDADLPVYDAEQLGLVKVTFNPVRKVARTSAIPQIGTKANTRAEDKSHPFTINGRLATSLQEFEFRAPLTDIDAGEVTVIYLRMIAEKWQAAQAKDFPTGAQSEECSSEDCDCFASEETNSDECDRIEVLPTFGDSIEVETQMAAVMNLLRN